MVRRYDSTDERQGNYQTRVIVFDVTDGAFDESSTLLLEAAVERGNA